MRIILLAVIFLLSACQSGRHIDYTDENAATLIFSSADLAAQPVICVAGEGFRETPLAVGIGGYKALDDLNEAMKKSAEVRARIAPATPVTAGFRYSKRSRTAARKRCQVMVTFDALAGETYQLRLEKSPFCTITTMRLQDDTWVAQERREEQQTCQ